MAGNITRKRTSTYTIDNLIPTHSSPMHVLANIVFLKVQKQRVSNLALTGRPVWIGMDIDGDGALAAVAFTFQTFNTKSVHDARSRALDVLSLPARLPQQKRREKLGHLAAHFIINIDNVRVGRSDPTSISTSRSICVYINFNTLMQVHSCM